MNTVQRFILVAGTAAALGYASEASALGPFSHTIPLNIPKGVHGMQPELALVYRPDGGNGILGVGWQLAGLSEITRVNNGNGITYSGIDTYAHSEEGVLVHQDDGSYRSKRDHLVKFVPSGTCGDGPCSWVAYYPSGLQYSYGTTADSRAAGSGNGQPVITWGLSQVQDLVGNYYQVAYTSSGNTLYPASISYTKGPWLSNTTTRVVSFGYEARPDSEPGFYQSYWRSLTQRLTSIWVDSGATHLRKYVLSYGEQGASTGRSHLTAFQEFGSYDGTHYYPSAVVQAFDWQQGSSALSAPVDAVLEIQQFAYSGGRNTFSDANYVILPGDFDGDGRADVAYVWRDSYDGTIHVKIKLATAGAFNEWTIASKGTWDPSTSTFVVGDFDGDGKTDIAYIFRNADHANCASIDVYRSTGVASTGFMRSRWADSARPWVPFSGVAPGDWQKYGTFVVGDFDGNGRSDIAYIYFNDSVYTLRSDVYLSSASGTFAWQPWSTSGGTFFSGPAWADHGTFLAGDFDGDGKTEIAYVFVNQTNANHYVNIDVYLPSDSQFESTHWLVEPYSDGWANCYHTQQADTFVLGDFNGDGKVDIAHVFNANGYLGMSLYESTGTSFLPLVNVTASQSTSPWAGGNNWKLCGDVLTGDFDGDGRTDVAYAYNPACDANGPPASPSSNGAVVIDGYIFHDNAVTVKRLGNDLKWMGQYAWGRNAQLVAGDFNGDGKSDIGYVWNDVYVLHVSAFLSDSIAPDLVNHIADGLGGEKQITYQSSLQTPGTVNPASSSPYGIALSVPVQLPTQVTSTDGRGGSYSVGYGYTDLRWLPGPLSQQRMLGFSSMTATDVGTGQSTVTNYYTTPGLEGQVSSTQVIATPVGVDPPTVIRQEQNYYTVVQSTINVQGEPTELVQEYQTVVQNCIFDGACYATTLTYSDFDAFYLPQTVTQSADDVPTVVTSTQYIHDTVNWVIGLVADVQVQSNGVVIAKAKNDWCWSGHACPPAFGQKDNTVILLSKSEWLDKPTPKWLTTNMTYYPTGLLRSVTPPAVSDPKTGTQIVTTTTTVYDSKFQAYPATVTTTSGNTKSQTTSRTYTDDGLLWQVTDPNGNTTTIAYDAFGRRQKETRPDGGASTYSYDNYGAIGGGYSPTFQHRSITTLVDDRSITRTEFFDGAGYVYHEETKGSADSRIVCVDHLKDASGRDWAVSVPAYSSSTCPAPTSPAGNTQGWSTTAYDGKGRINAVFAADGVTHTKYEYLVDSYGAYVQATDANQNVTKEYVDARNHVIRTVDAANQATVYTPDPLGRVTSVRLPDNSVLSTEYDSLGHRISQAEPQLLGKTMGYQYDGLDRVVAKLPAEDGVATTYRYDEDGVANGLGRLTSVTDASGTTQLGYDVAGRLASRIKVVNGVTYSESYRYDYAGRLGHVTYPDGSYVDYTYDALGRLFQMSFDGNVVATWTEYDAAGRPKAVSYANKVTSGYEYDAMERLKNLSTQSGTEVLQALTYDWDMRPGANTGGYNLGSIVDNRANKSANGISTDESVTYAYDSLYRVNSAVSNAWGERTYLYDASGNALHFNSAVDRWLTYDGNRLIAGTALSNVVYDAAGNMRAKTLDGVAWSYSWTGENLLSSVSKNGTIAAAMTYDFEGQRVTKVSKATDGSTVTTIYIGPEFEVTNYSNGSPTRYTLHLFAHGQHVASLTQAGPVAFASLDANRWRTELAVASMYDVRSLRGAMMKAGYLVRAAAAFAGGLYWFIPCVLVVFSSGVLVVFALSLVRRRRSVSRYPWRLRFASVGVVITFAVTGCGGPDTANGVRRFMPQGSRLAGMDPNSGLPLETYFYHVNHLGSASVVSDVSGNEVSRTAYLPFGEISSANSTGNGAVAFRFTGQRLDEETGLYYYGSRYYDPAVGRFVSADSVIPDLLDAQSWNAYSYVRDNPVRYVDPTGHDFGDGMWIYEPTGPGPYYPPNYVYPGGPVAPRRGRPGGTSDPRYRGSPGEGDPDFRRPTAPLPPPPAYPTPPVWSAPGVSPGASGAQVPQGPMALNVRANANGVSGRAGWSVTTGSSRGNSDEFVPAPQSLIGTAEYYLFRATNAPASYRNGTGPDYYVDYGYKYFMAFQGLRNSPVADDALRLFIDRAGSELQLALEKALAETPWLQNDRWKLGQAAFNMHPQAYGQAGFGELSLHDQLLVFGVIGMGDSFAFGIGTAFNMYIEGAGMLSAWPSVVQP